MKLIDFLKVVNKDDYIGIWDVDNKRSDRPTEQHYCKCRNLTWDKIHNIINYDVLGINHMEKGYLVRVYRQDRVEDSLKEWGIVNAYFKRLDQRNGIKN